MVRGHNVIASYSIYLRRWAVVDDRPCVIVLGALALIDDSADEAVVHRDQIGLWQILAAHRHAEHDVPTDDAQMRELRVQLAHLVARAVRRVFVRAALARDGDEGELHPEFSHDAARWAAAWPRHQSLLCSLRSHRAASACCSAFQSCVSMYASSPGGCP